MRRSPFLNLSRLLLLFTTITLTSSAQNSLKVRGEFEASPGIQTMEFGVAKFRAADQVLETITITGRKFQFQTTIGGFESYFFRHGKHTSYVDLGPGLANITLKDSTLSVIKVDGNLANEDASKYLKEMRSDTNFTNVRKLRSKLDDYQRGKNIDSSVLRQKVDAYSAAEQVSINAEISHSKQWFEANPLSWINSKILFNMIASVPEDYVKEVYKIMPEVIMHNSWAKLTSYWMDSLSTGGIFPVSNYPDRNGKIVSMNKEIKKGRYTLIDFWASWCVPCRQEIPFLAKVYAKYNKVDFNLISVSLDHDRQAWLNAIETDHLSWLQFSGDYKSDINKFLIPSIPANFLLDTKGRIIAKNLSAAQLDIFLKDKLN